MGTVNFSRWGWDFYLVMDSQKNGLQAFFALLFSSQRNGISPITEAISSTLEQTRTQRVPYQGCARVGFLDETRCSSRAPPSETGNDFTVPKACKELEVIYCVPHC